MDVVFLAIETHLEHINRQHVTYDCDCRSLNVKFLACPGAAAVQLVLHARILPHS